MMTTQENSFSNSTMSRLLNGAERCIVRHGYKASTIRRITQEAGVNVASINYHFGSKKELFFALIERRLRTVIENRNGELQKIGGGSSIDDVIRAYFGALLQIRQSVGREVMIVIWTLLISDPEVSRSSDRSDDGASVDVRRRYAQALASKASGVPVGELEWRLEVLDRFALCAMTGPDICWRSEVASAHDELAMQPQDSLSEGLLSIITSCIQAPLVIQKS